MRRIDDRSLAFLVSISDEIASLRNDVRTIQAGLIRIGAIAPKKAESAKAAATWNPPVLKRLGDIVTIIAQSNPAAAEALQEAGFDTETDPAFDERVDVATAPDILDFVDTADGLDPKLRDRDMNKRDWFTFDSDPTKKDFAVTKRNVADAADLKDPIPSDTQDDSDHKNQSKPDTGADSLT